MQEPWVGFEGDLVVVHYALELLERQGSKLYRDHGVHLPVALQDGRVLVTAAARRLQGNGGGPT